MSLLRYLRWRKTSIPDNDGSLSETSNVDPSNRDAEKHDFDKQGFEPMVAGMPSLSVLELTTETDAGLNPGELTFEEGAYCICVFISWFLTFSPYQSRHCRRTGTSSWGFQLYLTHVRSLSISPDCRLTTD